MAFLLPTDDAIYIYARGCKKALRKITLDQIIEDAVSLPDTMFSSVCMNDSFIYVSYAESNYAINKSSAEKGTYRYSLAEGTLEKVSSEYYYCMFVLDDLFIYAIKSSGRIDVLNCDGNIVETISLL